MIATVAALALSSVSASAALVVDTGVPLGISNYVLDPRQDLAGYFTLGSATTVTSVKGFINSNGGSTGTVRIYSDAALPDISNLLFSNTFAITASPFRGEWQGVSGQNWALAAGNYWVSFSSTGADGMFNGVPSPLSNHAFTISGNWTQFRTLNVGFQIEAGVVPEPATWAMLIGGFGMVGGSMRYRRRRTSVA
jgi:hypothetical protein